ncbi:hypothetical protein EX011_21455 [Salmonella enterica]|nr:hypothetical protein [Salmonella enterica]EBL7042092.1 hypothetical protein [Salmonella enterica]EHQ9605819.1 hypothetical protein [Salmonella enterica]EJF7575669.1 hypothetical protein [Salmonella enterica subsp. enterica]HAV7961471.1 hypothetical protein [Escherichia coli]
MSNKERWFSFSVLGGLLVLVLCWAVYVFGGMNELTVKKSWLEDPWGKDNTVFRTGHKVTVHREYCLKRDAEVTFNTMLMQSGVNVPIPKVSGVLHLFQGCGEFKYSFYLDGLPAGDYQFDSTLIYKSDSLGGTKELTLNALRMRITD